jgi:hypothetical protein
MSIVPAAGISNAFKSLAGALATIGASGKRQMRTWDRYPDPVFDRKSGSDSEQLSLP